MHVADFVVSFRKGCICVVDKDDCDISIMDDFELAFENNVEIIFNETFLNISFYFLQLWTVFISVIENENELVSLVKNTKFRKVRNHFQEKQQQDLKRMKTSNKTMTFGDTRTNIYCLTKQEYDNTLIESITTMYKRTTTSKKKSVLLGSKSFLTAMF